jgi:hypothetical protein
MDGAGSGSCPVAVFGVRGFELPGFTSRVELGRLNRYNDGLLTGRPGYDSRQRRKFFSLLNSIQVLGPTQPPIQWVPGPFSLGLRGRGVKLITLHHPVPR